MGFCVKWINFNLLSKILHGFFFAAHRKLSESQLGPHTFVLGVSASNFLKGFIGCCVVSLAQFDLTLAH